MLKLVFVIYFCYYLSIHYENVLNIKKIIFSWMKRALNFFKYQIPAFPVELLISILKELQSSLCHEEYNLPSLNHELLIQYQ